MSPQNRWPSRRRIKNTLLYGLGMGVIWSLSRLPNGLLRRLGSVFGRMAWVLARRERARALKNIECSDLGLQGDNARHLLRRVFAELGHRLVDWLTLVGSEKGRTRLISTAEFDPAGLEHLQQALARGGGVVVASAHFGDWELLGAALATQAKLSVLAKGSYDPRFSRRLGEARQAFGVTSLWVSEPGHLRQAMAALARGEQVGVLVDQPAGAEDVPFLGRPAKASTTAVGLARAAGATLLLGLIERRGAVHRITLEPIPMGEGRRGRVLADGIRRTTDSLAQAVRRRPEQWLWTLHRWR